MNGTKRYQECFGRLPRVNDISAEYERMKHTQSLGYEGKKFSEMLSHVIMRRLSFNKKCGGKQNE